MPAPQPPMRPKPVRPTQKEKGKGSILQKSVVHRHAHERFTALLWKAFAPFPCSHGADKHLHGEHTHVYSARNAREPCSVTG